MLEGGFSMAIFTTPGTQIISITESNYINDTPNIKSKVHIIRLNFDNPDDNKMEWVITKFPTTRRYIVDNKHIKYYNYFLKRIYNLKYYVINTSNRWNGLVSFYKRNNKVLLDITQLTTPEKNFVFYSLKDILFNTEVIMISKSDYDNNKQIIDNWKGNCIIEDPNYII